METTRAIETRRSVREYTGEPVAEQEIAMLLEAARWAPSGLNNQPWRFMPITDRALITSIAQMTRYRGVVEGASALIAVFLCAEDVYDRTKDLLSAGAAVENMLLAAHDSGLGACWLGEILARREEVEALLEVPAGMELVAVVALGRPARQPGAGVRRPVEKLVLTPPAGQ